MALFQQVWMRQLTALAVFLAGWEALARIRQLEQF